MKKGRRRAGFWQCAWCQRQFLFIIFMIIPTFNVFRMSLYKWGGYSNKKTFVGLENFAKLMDDSKFLQSFQNTLLLIVIVTVVTMGLALIFAAILTREKIKGQNFFPRSILHSKHTVSRYHQCNLQRNL